MFDKYSPTKETAHDKKLLYYFYPCQIDHWKKLVMKNDVIRQINNQTCNLQKAFFVFSAVAENWLVSTEVTAEHIRPMEPITRAWTSCRMTIHPCKRSLLSCCRFVGFWSLLNPCWMRWSADFISSTLPSRWKRLSAVSRTDSDLWIIHLGWHRHQCICTWWWFS